MIKYLPLKYNMTFHRLVAKMIVFATMGHLICHCLNYANKPIIIDVLGIAPWITGVVITIAMIFIYTASPDKVRKADYGLFWWNHHVLFVYFIVLLFHGLSGMTFLKIGTAPLVLYLCERIFTTKSAKEVSVRRIKFIDPVLEIRFQVN